MRLGAVGDAATCPSGQYENAMLVGYQATGLEPVRAEHCDQAVTYWLAPPLTAWELIRLSASYVRVYSEL